MSELDQLLDKFITSLTINGELPQLELPSVSQDEVDEVIENHEKHIIDPKTFKGLKRLTQLMEVARIVAQLQKG